jgi:endogenous inhibitor of DNA gyrase (YacG/DUF329 family)
MSESIVRATCPACGDVVVTTRDVGLRLDEAQSRFLFDCPRCHRQVSREVPSGIVHILRVAGVQLVDPEPELISQSELAEFLAEFDDVDCFDELRRLGA